MIDEKELQEHRYWSKKELSSPDDSDSWKYVDAGFLQRLTRLRSIYCKPIVPNSVFRTVLHNAAVGGVSNSSHLLGRAADLPVSAFDYCAQENTYNILSEAATSRERWDILSSSTTPKSEIIQAALEAGFRRIGVGKSFIHVDYDLIKTPNLCWIYT